MDNIPPPTAHEKQPAGKKRTTMQRKWTVMVRDYDKFTAMKNTLDKLPNKSLTEEMVTIKAAIDEHFTAPELIEVFEGVYAVHLDWEMPEWFMEKMGIQVDNGERDTPMENAEDQCEGAEE